MSPSPARRRHLSSSPFKPAVAPEIEEFRLGALVCHDSYGVGRVVGAEALAVTVDFRTSTVRIVSPFDKMTKL